MTDIGLSKESTMNIGKIIEIVSRETSLTYRHDGEKGNTMLLSHVIDTHKATDHITYKLLQSNVVGMGSMDRIFSYSIYKYDGKEVVRRIIDGIKNEQAVFSIWNDVKKGEQK